MTALSLSDGALTSARPRSLARCSRVVHEKNAIVVAVALTLLCCAIDLVTGADITVNFLYLIPIFLASWFRRWAGAVMVIATSMLGRLLAMEYTETPQLSLLHIAWNTFAETIAFLAFALLVIALRDRVKEAQSKLIATTEQLRHADRLTTLGKLAAGVAHELGTPLHVITLRAEMLCGGKSSEQQTAAAAESILKQGERMGAILEQLLHFGRRAASSRARTDLRAVVREAVQLVQPALILGDVEIRVAEGAEPLWADVNFAEMEQVISNLLLNAVQAVPRSAIINVEMGRRQIAGPDSRPQTVAFIAVHDRGTGIAPEHLPHIFDPFYTTKEVGEGTGLGLSVSFGIVNDHGGRIDVESRLDEGSRFTILLPV